MPTLAAIVNRVFLHQTAAYWAKTGSDQYGKPVYADPVDVAVRGEDTQAELILEDGRRVLARGYVLSVTFLAAGSLLLLGGVAVWQAQVTYPALPTMLQGGYEIGRQRTTPDIKNVSTIYECWLL